MCRGARERVEVKADVVMVVASGDVGVFMLSYIVE